MNRTLKAISMLWSGTVLGSGCIFLTHIVLARHTSTEDFSTFSAALSFIMLISPLIGFGIPALWLKLFGEEGYGAQRWIPASQRFMKSSAAGVLLLLILWAFLLPHGPRLRSLLLILSFHLLAQFATEQASTILRLEGRTRDLTLLQGLPHALRLAWTLIACSLASPQHTIDWITWGYAVIGAGVLCLGLYHQRRAGRGLWTLQDHPRTSQPPSDAMAMGTLVRQAWPFGMAGFFYLLFLQSGIVVLKYIEGPGAVAVMSIGIQIMSGIYILPVVVYQKFLLADFHRWARHDPDRLHRVSRTSLMVMGASGLAIALLMSLMAKPLLHLLFRGRLDSHLGDLMLIFLATPVRFLSDGFGALLVTGENMRRKVTFMGMAALTSFTLNLVLVPSMGLRGCVLSTLACECLLLALYIRGVNQWVFPGRPLWTSTT